MDFLSRWWKWLNWSKPADVAGAIKHVELCQSFGESLRKSVSRWLVEYYGERCPDHSDGCPCCQKWKAFESLFEDV